MIQKTSSCQLAVGPLLAKSLSAPLDFGHRRLIYHETETTGFSYHETQKNQKPLNGQNALHAVCGFTADADSLSQKSNSPANTPVFFLKLKNWYIIPEMWKKNLGTVVSTIYNLYPYQGKWSSFDSVWLYNIFQLGWSHHHFLWTSAALQVKRPSCRSVLRCLIVLPC